MIYEIDSPHKRPTVRVSNSELNDKAHCDRYSDLSSPNRQGLESRHPQVALHLGSAVHAALEAFYVHQSLDPVARSDKTRAAYEAFVQDQIDTIGDNITEERASDLAEASDLGRTMIQTYMEYAQDADDFDVILVEQEFEVPIPNTRIWLSGDDGVYPWVDEAFLLRNINWIQKEQSSGRLWMPALLVGTMDGLVRTKSTGDICVMEHKTRSAQRPFPMEYLNIELQTARYQWATQKAIDAGQTDLEPGTKVSSVVYNVLYKRAPKEPALVQSGKRLSKTKISTTPRTWPEAIKKHGFDPADYKDLIAEANSKGYTSFVMRPPPIRRSQKQLDRVGEHYLPREWYALATMEEDPLPNSSEDCLWRCSFGELCRSIQNGEDVEWIKGQEFRVRGQRGGVYPIPRDLKEVPE